MSTGYDQEGMARLRCLGPPDGPAFAPNAFAGMYPVVETYAPTVPLGVGNFSFELWFRWALGNANRTSDVWSVIGAMAPVGGGFYEPRALLQLANNSYTINGVQYRPPGGPTIEIVGVPVPEDWCHIAVNYNRVGNMEVFVNTVSGGTIAINAVNCLTPRFYPLCGQYGTDLQFDPVIGSWDDPVDAWDDFTQGRARIGSIAFHNRLLTAAEIRLAWEQKRINDFGAATTLLRWNWRTVNGLTAWDENPLHIVTSIRSTISVPTAAPMGARTTVTVPDESGNGRILTMPSVTAYGTASGPLEDIGPPVVEIAGRRAWCGFVADPFWV